MCVIVWKPEGVKLSSSILEACAAVNPHGWGIMRRASGRDGRGRVKVDRGMRTADALEVAEKIGRKAAAFHFRIATVGSVRVENTHPFQIGETGAYLMHNGTLPRGVVEVTGDISDSEAFAETAARWVEPVGVGALVTAGGVGVIENVIGPDNKMLIMLPDGSHAICNERAGTWLNGAWFSNSRWLGAYRAPDRQRRELAWI